MDQKTKDLMFSSASVEWATPNVLFNVLNKRYRFNLDPCATDDNHKCAVYFTKEMDGLKQSWKRKRFFMNPPYNDSENPCSALCKKKRCVKRGYHIRVYLPGLGDWIKKAMLSCQDEKAFGGCLLPARTCSKWYHEMVIPSASEIWFIKGRIRFNDADSAPFPSIFVVFNAGPPSDTILFGTMDTEGKILHQYTASRVDVEKV